jgi:hypothetical protein
MFLVFWKNSQHLTLQCRTIEAACGDRRGLAGDALSGGLTIGILADVWWGGGN